MSLRHIQNTGIED